MPQSENASIEPVADPAHGGSFASVIRTRLAQFLQRLGLAFRLVFDRNMDQRMMSCLMSPLGSPTAGQLTLLYESEYKRLHELSETVEQLSSELAKVRQATASRQLSNLTTIADCDRFVSRIIQSLTNARESSEQAVLTIGHHVSNLFDIARDDNELSMEVLNRVLGSTPNGSQPQPEQLSSIVRSQEVCVTTFIQETRSFFRTPV